MQHLPLIDVALVGLAVGAGSAWTGLGAGLSAPLLAWLGLPLPAALLAAKLPVAASDVAAALGLSRAGGGTGPGACDAAPGIDGAALWMTLIAGAASAAVVLYWAPVLALGLSAVLLLVALVAAWLGATPRWQSICWGGYIGGCGVGAGVMMRSTRLQRGEPWWWLSLEARRVGAAANVGAVLVLACGGFTAEPRLWCLAASQGLGAWCASSAMAAWRRRPIRRALQSPQ